MVNPVTLNRASWSPLQPLLQQAVNCQIRFHSAGFITNGWSLVSNANLTVRSKLFARASVAPSSAFANSRAPLLAPGPECLTRQSDTPTPDRCIFWSSSLIISLQLKTQNSAATSNEKQPAKKLKANHERRDGCHTLSHQGSQRWHEEGNKHLQPAWLKKKQAAGNNSAATEASASNAIIKKHEKKR
jgi:hypothetical protein